MKILQINGWTGRIRDGLGRFVVEGGYDIVCMQEAIWSDNCNSYLELYVDTVDKIKNAAGFDYVYKTSNYGTKVLDGGGRFEIGNAIMSRIPFVHTKEAMVLGDYGVVKNIANLDAMTKHCYRAQKVVLDNGVAIVNYHGYYKKDPLGDEVSVECMRKVVDLIKDDYCPTILCGDLNVIAEAPAMRELDFMNDLTALNHVNTTLRNVRFVKDVACDHILITNELKCEKFDVINAAISDHKALIAEVRLS